MQITQEKHNDIAIVLLDEEHLDAGNADDFKRDISPILDGNLRVILDMGPVQFVDSTGLGAILSCLRRLTAANGDLKLCALSRQVKSVFELSRMHRIIDIFNTREEALASFGAEK